MINKRLIIITGYKCNNNCIFCLNCSKSKQISTENIKKILRENISKFKEIEFIGGEPTIHENIIGLVVFAKKLGYKDIRIGTNGRMYSNKLFCKSISKAGVNSISFSLHGSTAEIHDSITRTPGSFYQTIQGIKNALCYKEWNLYVDTVICKINLKDIINLQSLLIKLGVTRWQICDLIPEGVGKKHYRAIYANLNSLKKLNEITGKVKSFENISFVDFPHCIFNKETIDNSKITISKIKDRAKSIQINEKEERIFHDQVGEFENIYKTKIDICKNCTHNSICGGFWDHSINLEDFSKWIPIK